MKATQMKLMNLESVLLNFRVEAGAPTPAILEEYCRQYPQFARELTDYALEWLIDVAMEAVEAPTESAAAVPSSPLVSKAISHLYGRIREREAGKAAEVRLSGQQVLNPFDELTVPRVRAIGAELGINTPLFSKFRNRLVDPETVPRAFLDRFARLLECKVEEFLGYLELPQTVHSAADYKAGGKPSVRKRKESFEDAVGSSLLDEKQKRALLKG